MWSTMDAVYFIWNETFCIHGYGRSDGDGDGDGAVPEFYAWHIS